MDDPVRIPLSSGITRASWSAIPRRRSAWARSITPPSVVIRPPSKAALTFLRATAGRSKGRGDIVVHNSLPFLDRWAASATGIMPHIHVSGYFRLTVRLTVPADEVIE